MTSIRLEDIEYYKLKGKSIKTLILNENGVLDAMLTKENKIDVYVFENGRALYDFGSHALLFKTRQDLEKYNSICEGKAKNEIADINYSTFITNVDSLVDAFEKQFHIKIDFGDLSSLSIVDSLINGEKNKRAFIKKWEYSLVAILGKFILNRVPNSKWVLMKIDTNRSLAVIFTDPNILFSPYDILMSQTKKGANGKSLQDQILWELKIKFNN